MERRSSGPGTDVPTLDVIMPMQLQLLDHSVICFGTRLPQSVYTDDHRYPRVSRQDDGMLGVRHPDEQFQVWQSLFR